MAEVATNLWAIDAPEEATKKELPVQIRGFEQVSTLDPKSKLLPVLISTQQEFLDPITFFFHDQFQRQLRTS